MIYDALFIILLNTYCCACMNFSTDIVYYDNILFIKIYNIIYYSPSIQYNQIAPFISENRS